MKMTGAQIILECLKREGVQHVFGYPGGAVIDLYDELTRCPEIKHYLVRHEQAAVHAADGYARASDKGPAPKLRFKSMTQDDVVVVDKFSTRMEAEMAAGILEAEGIYALVTADDAGGTYPPLQYLRGVRLIVAPEDERRAREILADWRTAPELEAEEEPEE